jgi:thermitase
VDLGAAGRDDTFGYGRINALAALQEVHTATGTRARASSAERSVTAPSVIPADAEFVPGRVLVRFKPDAAAPDRDHALQATGAIIVDKIPQIDWSVLQVPAGSERSTVARLRADPRVEFAEPDYIVYAIR